MKKTLSTLVMTAALITSGCATILTDETQQINVGTTTGQKIDVTIDGQTFQAPGVITVKKSKEQNKFLMTNAEGCAERTVLNRSVEPTFFVNILSGGAFGSTTDYATDKMWKYDDSVTISCSN
ncbi:MAG: adenosine deaminase [Alkalimonas sp.]|nr:adenosine deaminase [Alkalimonas sp.]